MEKIEKGESYCKNNRSSFSFSVYISDTGSEDPSRSFVYNTPEMTESFKTGFSMVRSHSALTYAAKWHGTGCQMNYGIVYAAATETAGAKKLFCEALSSLKNKEPADVDVILQYGLLPPKCHRSESEGAVRRFLLP